jgi:hypothetical protein
MANEILTNKISPDTGTAFTLGDSGDTFTFPSGVTVANSGTVTGFGAGKVIQMKQTTFDTVYTFGNATLTELNTGNRVTITPTSTSNKLLLECYISSNFVGGGNICSYMWYDVTGTAVFAPSTVTTGSRLKNHTGYRFTASDANDCSFIYIRCLAACPRTSESVFTPYISAQTASTFYINYSNSDGSDWQANTPSIMTATEIETV